MDNLETALTGVLSQPDAMEKLQSMARQLGLAPQTAEPPKEETPPLAPEAMQALAGALSEAGQPNEITALLEALRPLLSPSRQGKLNRAIRVVHLIRAAQAASGVLEL